MCKRVRLLTYPFTQHGPVYIMKEWVKILMAQIGLKALTPKNPWFCEIPWISLPHTGADVKSTYQHNLASNNLTTKKFFIGWLYFNTKNNFW